MNGNDKKKRTTITLSFKKDNKRPSTTDISSNIKNMLAERQREIKENQNRKFLEQKQMREKQENKTLAVEEKRDIEDRKDVVNTYNFVASRSVGFANGGKNNNRNNDRNNDRNNNTNGNSRNNHNQNNNNRKYTEEERREYLKRKEEQEKRKNEKKQEEETIKKEVEKQFETKSDKKASFKEVKNKNFTRSSEEEESKNDKKLAKDKSDKFMNNLHTFVFNEDGELENERKSFSKLNRKKNKNRNGQEITNKQKIFQTVNIPEFISVSDLAERMNEKKADVIKKLLTMGIKANINQMIDADTAELLVSEFGHDSKRVSYSDVEKILTNEKEEGEFLKRNPVVTVMGHVDHGKTSLLDALRSTRVAEGEYGGITQHIGASRVEMKDGKFITFIDTPGHEAFTEMRMRGANITDIVILVVAADDGIQNQTIEAINHTKAANVPMIVAINKIDKPDANPEAIKQALLQYNVILEDFGGEVMSVAVSAKNRINLDKLLETILLQAEMLELKAPIDCKATGAVIESKMDSQKGVLTTVLVQKGVLKIGDIILAGTSFGRVKRMLDDKKKVQENVHPSMAVEVLGFNTSPSAGDIFNVLETEREAREIIAYRERKNLENKEAGRSGKSFENLLQSVGNNKKQLSVIVKTDVSGSIEAITGSLVKLSNEEVYVVIVHSAVGIINESDVNLANTSKAIIVGFNVRATNEAKNLSKQYDITIKYYSIIYDILDDLKAIMSGLLSPIKKEEILGQAEIRNVIKITNIGKIAGCFVLDGEIQRNANVRLIRDGVVIFTGKIKTLRRFKEDVKEVKNNYECGVVIENYDDIKEKDIIECYKIVEEKKEL